MQGPRRALRALRPFLSIRAGPLADQVGHAAAATTLVNGKKT